MDTKKAKKCAILVAEGSEEIEFSTCFDLLKRAGCTVDVLAVDVSGETGPWKIELSRGLLILAEKRLDDSTASRIAELYDVIVLPGGLKGARKFENDKLTQQCLNDLGHLKDHWVCAICASALAIAAAPAFHERTLTGHPSVWEELKNAKKVNVDESARVKIDGNLITSQGPGTAMQFGLAIIENCIGKDVRDEVAKPLVLKNVML